MSFDPNYNSILQDPEYLLKNPGYIKQAHDLLVQYGIIPSPGGAGGLSQGSGSTAGPLPQGGSGNPGPGGDMPFGYDAATAQEVAANPYSIAAMLRKNYTSALGSNATGANTHGALFSGAYQNANLHSLDDYQKNLSGAGTELIGKLGDVGTQRTTTLGDIWTRLSGATGDTTADTTAYGPAAAPVGTAIGKGLPQPQGAYVRTGPETPGAVAAKIRAPGIGGRGHIT